MAILFGCCVLTPKKTRGDSAAAARAAEWCATPKKTWRFRRRCARGGMVRYAEKDMEIPPPLRARRNGALTQKKKLRGWMGAAQPPPSTPASSSLRKLWGTPFRLKLCFKRNPLFPIL